MLLLNLKTTSKALVVVVCLLAGVASASAEKVLLSGANVHTVSGETLSPGEVLFEDGRITAVGARVPADGATRVELSGLHVYPGLVALNTVLGLTEISGVRATQDSAEVGEYTPDVESWIAVNPDSELIPVARANGVAYFQPVAKGGVIAGESGLVATEGWTTEQRVLKDAVALDLYWPSMSLDLTTRESARAARTRPKPIEEQTKDRRLRIRALADFFEEARAYAKAREAAEKGKAAAPERIPAWEAMLPYVRGELPIMVHADDLRQIKAAVDWATTNHYRIILAGARDAWKAADLLATNQVPVVFEHTFSLPTRDTESYDVYFRAAQVLHKAGVRVAFCTPCDSFEAAQVRNLPYSAAQAAAFGLPEAEALKGITLYPAQMAGAGDRLGSIEVGKEATLLAADGNILDIRSNVKRMWIAGREVSLETRHTRLYERYKNRPKPR